MKGSPAVKCSAADSFCCREVAGGVAASMERLGAGIEKQRSAFTLHALCGFVIPTASISFSKLTRFNTRLRL